jgi:hypothetical protein
VLDENKSDDRMNKKMGWESKMGGTEEGDEGTNWTNMWKNGSGDTSLHRERNVIIL